MDTLSVIALIVVALVILAVIIAYRRRLAIVLEFLGLKLNVQAENEPAEKNDGPPEAAYSPAGVRLEDVESTAGGLLIEEGKSETGSGIEVKGATVKDDIIIGTGHSGHPKAGPPA